MQMQMQRDRRNSECEMSMVPWRALAHGLLHLLRQKCRYGQRRDTVALWPHAVENEAEVPPPDLGADLPGELGRLGEYEDEERYVGLFYVVPELPGRLG